MITWKKTRSFGLLFIASSLLLSFLASALLPFVVNAASAYDSTYRTTDTLDIKTDYFGICDVERDISVNWAGYIMDDTKWSQDHGITLDNRETVQESFQAALDHGAWAVTKRTRVESTSPTQQRDSVEVVWTENRASATLDFVTDGSFKGLQANGSDLWFLSIGIEKVWTPLGAGECEPRIYEAYQPDYPTDIKYISDEQSLTGVTSGRENYFASFWTLNTPDGYEGLPIRTAAPTPESTVHPDIQYTVRDKRVELLYKQNIVGGCVMDWSWSIEGGEASVVETKPATDIFVVNVPEYGSYSFIAVLKYYAGPVICEEFGENVTVLPTILTLEIDGTDFTGSTDEMDCTDGEFSSCIAPSPFEDCSVYAGTFPYGFGGGDFPDIIGGVGCLLGNFLTGMGIFFHNLFVPTSRFISANFTNLQGVLDDNGGIAAVITAPIVSLEGLTSNTCSTLTLPLPYVGENINLPCMENFYNEAGGAFFTMYQTITSGVIAYYVILGTLAMIKGFKDPENDKIEALHL